jgi:hypothetical protein
MAPGKTIWDVIFSGPYGRSPAAPYRIDVRDHPDATPLRQMKRISSVCYRHTGQPPLRSCHEVEGGSSPPPLRARASARRCDAIGHLSASYASKGAPRHLTPHVARAPPEPSHSEPLAPEPPPTATMSSCHRPPSTAWMVRRLDSIGRER